ncbi:MAG: hypothetical protein EBZ69_03650 [Alphaproteobacteria bacterium]|nr:hypothetical protein [Alphaproteobacteria bacterium]NDC55895.1 hypothetical protein [Alphaproteobacteria bacterium]NDG03943.1 hypothetical protein [Alphaproteobacteria bacterium]
MPLEMRVMDLLISKICHDLISPVSAINNGVELFTEVGGDVGAEAMTLIGNSADQASKKLRFFRLSYGRAGAEAGQSLKDVRHIATEALTHGKVTAQWEAGLDTSELLLSQGGVKTVLNMALLAEEALPYGGQISIGAGAQARQVVVRAEGRSAGLNPASQGALDGHVAVDDLGPRTIQAYITRLNAGFYRLMLKTEVGPDMYQLSVISHQSSVISDR